MPTRFHAEDRATRPGARVATSTPTGLRCGAGVLLLAATHDAITARAAAGVLFTRIAGEMGLSVHGVRRVVHG